MTHRNDRYAGDLTEADYKLFGGTGVYNMVMPYRQQNATQLDWALKYGVQVSYSIKDDFCGYRACDFVCEARERALPDGALLRTSPLPRRRNRSNRTSLALFSFFHSLSLARTFELVALCASQFSADVRNSNVTSSSHTYISIYIHTYTYQRHSLKCNTSAAEDDVVTKIVTQFRDHPSILFWYTNDELGVRL